jgi:hypothetical protein
MKVCFGISGGSGSLLLGGKAESTCIPSEYAPGIHSQSVKALLGIAWHRIFHGESTSIQPQRASGWRRQRRRGRGSGHLRSFIESHASPGVPAGRTASRPPSSVTVGMHSRFIERPKLQCADFGPRVAHTGLERHGQLPIPSVGSGHADQSTCGRLGRLDIPYGVLPLPVTVLPVMVAPWPRSVLIP